jgi:ferredoxin
MAQKFRVVLDSTACSGHGRCYSESPGVFEPDEQGFGVVVESIVGEDRLQEAKRGERLCPERAITVVTIEEETPT